MIDISMVNWPVTIGLGVLQFGSYLLFRTNRIMSFPVAILLFVFSASLVVLLKLLAPAVNATIGLLVLCALVAVLGFILLKEKSWISVVTALGAAGITMVVFVSSQLITRFWGLSSIGFGDGQTVLNISESFQSGIYAKPDALIGLKRGFGLPAYQSLGFEGEFLVGFLPIVFLAALVATYALLSFVVQNKLVRNVGFASVVVVLVSTESVARHIYLMNTHTLLWAIFAVLLTGLLKFAGGEKDTSTWAMVLIALGTGSMLRADNLLIMAPVLVFLTWVMRSESTAKQLALWAATFFPFAAWATVLDFGLPVVGLLGFPLIAVAAVAVGWLLMRLMKLDWVKDKTMQRSGVVVLGLTVLVAMMFSPSFWTSLENLFINLFLGEGLWGATPLVSLVAYGVLVVLGRGPSSEMQKWLFAFVSGTLAVLMMAKFGDGLSQSATLGGFARIGWGDSLNRMSVYLIPAVVALLLSRGEKAWLNFEQNKQEDHTKTGSGSKSRSQR